METEILNISLTTEEIKYALENRGIEPTKEHINGVVKHLNKNVLYENMIQEALEVINTATYDYISSKDFSIVKK